MEDANITPLRALRKRKGLTLEQVAEGIGESDTGNLSRIERGIQKSLPLTAKLVDYFKGEISEAQILFPERFPEEPEVKRPRRTIKTATAAR